MAMISEQALFSILGKEQLPFDHSRSALRYFVPSLNGKAVAHSTFSREEVREISNKLKDIVTSRGSLGGKTERPWSMDPSLTEELDPDKVWWGFEFETGYQSQESRAEVLGHVWDNWDGVAFDAEGEGDFFSEVTFSPQEMDKFLDGSAKAVEFMDYLTGEGQGHTLRTEEMMVGTHLNISLPNIDYSTTELVAESLTYSGKQLSPEDCEGLFGRGLMYGWFYARSSSRPYIEGKLFRTTYDSEEFAGYLKVCEGITVIALALQEAYAQEGNGAFMCDNFVEVCRNGDEPSIVPASISRSALLCGYYYEDNDSDYYDEPDYDPDYDDLPAEPF